VKQLYSSIHNYSYLQSVQSILVRWNFQVSVIVETTQQKVLEKIDGHSLKEVAQT
jgi:hypothetical protein